ncbi:hypothetical protein AB1Y20_015986 [Prymnesium parvum]|uniref:SLC41A/MgtE integral membrane domain-containing protein n=1 Tax=Prymnesium parvum TaxID=97485 RepID=A0AB34K028_PRYPA
MRALAPLLLPLLASAAAPLRPSPPASRDTHLCRKPALPIAAPPLRLRGGSAAAASPLADYSHASLASLIVSRGGWLAVFLLSLSLTSLVMSSFEHTLAQQIELAYFVPLLIGHGGNAGGQTVGAVLGALSAGQVRQADWAAVLVKEALAGLGAGSLACVAVLPLLLAMQISRHVSAAILITMPTLTVMASALGAALPFAVAAMGGDPSVIAAPAMTTLVDVGGLLAYFLIARLVFAVFGKKMGDAPADAKKGH